MIVRLPLNTITETHLLHDHYGATMGDETACGSHSMMWVLLMNFHALFVQYHIYQDSCIPAYHFYTCYLASAIDEIYAHSSSF